MAEPENFEEDLFADLYAEDETVAKLAEVIDVKPEPVPVKEDVPAEQNEPNGDVDQDMYGKEEDMDDDIDFNLGNGNSNGNGYDTPSHSEAHGPGIKEDG